MAITTVLTIFAFLLISNVEAQLKKCNLPVPHESITTANCTFEDSLVCGFSHHNFEWTRNQLPPIFLALGPRHDHTFEFSIGYYMYARAGLGSVDSVGRLNSYILTGPITPACVTFWYHMYGSGIGTLNVYVLRNGSRGTIWTVSGNQGNSWNVANVSLATVSSNTSYQIVFEAAPGTNLGNIAIDDFSVTEGSCSQSQPTIADMCTFDNNQCGFFQDNSDDFDWKRKALSTFNYGPEYDHTLGQAVVGNYMYLEFAFNDVGRLNSTNLTGPITPTCVTFWYHLYGLDIGTLNVYVWRDGSRGFPIWTSSGNQGNSWNIANVTLNAAPCDTPYQIVFEANISNGRGGIAIDDFSVTPGGCSPDAITEWSNWADNGTCSTTCGPGSQMQSRTRTCTGSCPSDFTPVETRTVTCVHICACPW